MYLKHNDDEKVFDYQVNTREVIAHIVDKHGNGELLTAILTAMEHHGLNLVLSELGYTLDPR